MNRFVILIMIVFLLGCVGCTAVESTPVETNTPTKKTIITDVPYGATTVEDTPEPTISVPTATAIQKPTFTKTSTQPKIEVSNPKQENYDFSQYGPLAYIDTTVEKMTIRMINADGSMADWKFEPEDDYSFSEIAWSADGATLVFTTTLDGINLLSIEDKNFINLPATNAFSIIFSPSFSPDGKFITFFGYNEGVIFRISVDGTDLVNLTPAGSYRNSYESPSWSPSGTQIVYARPYIDGKVYIMNADGTAPRTLIETGWNDHPRYSPDGRWLAFIRSNNSQRFLYAMPVGGGTYRPLSGSDKDVLNFSWSPDGRYLVYEDFVCQGNCETKYWMVEFATGLTWEFKRPQGAFGELKWSPLMQTAQTREDCTGGWSRLVIGKLVQLIGNEPNRVRTNPERGENVVSQFDANESYILLDGPVCADGLVWWEIADPRLPGGSGWTAEGDGQSYWLERVFP